MIFQYAHFQSSIGQYSGQNSGRLLALVLPRSHMLNRPKVNFSKVCAHCGSSEILSQILPTLKTERENTLYSLKSLEIPLLTYLLWKPTYIIGEFIFQKKWIAQKPEHFYGHCCVCVIFFVKHLKKPFLTKDTCYKPWNFCRSGITGSKIWIILK